MSDQISRYRLFMVALCACFALTACQVNVAAPTLTATATSAPTIKPTATAIPPTATPLPPTSTPIPPTRKFQSIVNALQYDMSGQPPEMQQAYGLYRQGIDVLNSRSVTILDCNKGGGLVGKLDFALALPALRESEGLLIQALSQLGQ